MVRMNDNTVRVNLIIKFSYDDNVFVSKILTPINS